MALYDIVSGTSAVASDVEQLINIFNGKHDVGTINLAPALSAPSSSSFTLTPQAGNSLGVGAYNYQFTYVTGQYKSDGFTLVKTGETLPSATQSFTTTSGNTAVKITLPTSGLPTSAIAINIYRTSVGGSDYKLVATVKVGSANYTDSTADASRGAQTPPTINTTGTSISYPSIPHLHIEMNMDYAIAANTDTALYQGNFTRKSINGGWVDAVDRWVVPTTGVFNVTAFLAMTPSANGIELRCRVFVYNSDNSVKDTYTIGTDNANNGRWVYAGGSLDIYLNKGERIAIVGSQDSTGYQTLKQGRLTAVLVGKY